MSKLAHSDDENMARMAVKSLIETGNEDFSGLHRIDHIAAYGCTHEDGPHRIACEKPATYETDDGDWYCEKHAIDWAVSTIKSVTVSKAQR